MPFCEFGKNVKKRLVDIDQTQDWLIAQVRDETGLFFDSSYLHKILKGSRSPETIVAAINKILQTN